MAAFNEQLLNFPALATGAIPQAYLAVKGAASGLKTPGVAMSAAAADKSIGIAQTDAASGDVVTVCPLGRSLAIAGGAVAVWDEVTANGSGRLVTAASGDLGVIGVAMEAAAADGDQFSVWVQRSKTTR